MASTTFVNGVTLTDQDWFNDVNDTTYDLLGNGVSAATTKAIARANLTLNTLTTDAAPDPSADWVETYDTSATTSKKVQLGNIRAVSATAQASTSGTSIDFTGIPSGVKQITVMFAGVSTSGTSNPLIQIGDSGGIESSGYLSGGTNLANAGAIAISAYTAGFGILSASAASVLHGSIILSLLDSVNNTWVASGSLYTSNTPVSFLVAGSKSTSAVLDRVRITTAGGSDTFDAGSINISYS